MEHKRTNIIMTAMIAVLVVGALAGAYFTARTLQPMMSGKGHDAMPMNGHDESDVYKKYAALRGETYDKAFLADMIVHHQGAIAMATMARSSAVHQEIRDLAAAIASAQTQEIAKMTDYQARWGYAKSSGSMMADDGSMAMMGGELQGMTGDAFDRKFLDLMIDHHEQAVDMSRSAATNAAHQEIKDLASGIIAAQTKEIADMKAWQRQWGYRV